MCQTEIWSLCLSALCSATGRATPTTSHLWRWTLGTGRSSPRLWTRRIDSTSTSAGRWHSREVCALHAVTSVASNQILLWVLIGLLHLPWWRVSTLTVLLDVICASLALLLLSYILQSTKHPLHSAHLAPGSWKCPSSAASCMKVGEEYVSLGQVESGPTWDGNVLKLQYSSGQICPDGQRNRTSIVRFKCDKDRVVRETLSLSRVSIMVLDPVFMAQIQCVNLNKNINVCFCPQDSRPTMISALEDCVYTFLWLTAAACPLNSSEHDDCKVTNPATGQFLTQYINLYLFNIIFWSFYSSTLETVKKWGVKCAGSFFFFFFKRWPSNLNLSPQGHLFDLNALTKEGGYTVYDHQDPKKMFRMNICGNVANAGCSPETGL